MAPPTDDGGSPAPIDRPVLEFVQTRLQATRQISGATVTDASGHLVLQVDMSQSYYPDAVDDAQLTVRWYTNDDFKINYRERHTDHAWECRWDRHPNPHNTRNHFHPPPAASTPGEDTSWPTDHRDVVALVLDEIEERIATLWSD
ncbi:hypothetical protein B4589_000405 [Halolamina sp. CBA1230]|uniref:hypothetical protein n=1 Tax=Halolamina sp. CBA1230 TaxID=1853690 RepID=UPI0009A21998|nr:hypothetical protein [Halolamina sp. CBA1230]QKY18903.1 hypothetical protein B4589_000405 [Halolamina sp. CBA1230]